MRVVRVLVADDHPVFRDGLCALLSLYEEMLVVGHASTGDEAVEATVRMKPDVVLMDLRMPGCDGVEATRRIHAIDPAVAVVVLTMVDDDEAVFAAVRAGARGYLLKEADADDVSAPPARTVAFPELTAGERAVLSLISGGLSNAEIAHRLTLSPKTVRNRVSSIFAKLHLRDRAEAIVRARDAGLSTDLQ
jgi:DNA-binding NarL/FixJ family response regulator